MKTIRFIKEIFKEFPSLMITNIVLLLLVNLFATCSLLSISPVVDLYIHPDLKGISPLTLRIIHYAEILGIKVNFFNWVIILITLVMISSIVQVGVRYSILRIKYAVLRKIIIGAFRDFFYTRWNFFSQANQGELLNTFTREITVVGNAFGAMGLFFSYIIQIIFFISVPFYISWQVTLISIIIVAILSLPFLLLGKISYRLGAQITSKANYMLSVIQENLSFAKIVMGFGSQQKTIQNIAKAYDSRIKTVIKSEILNIAIPTFYRPCAIIMVFVALFAAKHFHVALSEITVLILALFQVGIAGGFLCTLKNSIDNFFPSYEQIKRLRNKAQRMKKDSGDRIFDRLNEAIELKDVGFSFPSRPVVLENINVKIPKGKMIAFVGESGAGKTTLIDIIMGFHEPTHGVIMIDGVPLQNYDINSFRHKIGYVPQDSILFNLSIRDNLLWVCDSASDEDIKEACHMAYADEFITQFPEGYDTVVGDRGVRLSGGQIQRIALARALLRKPQLLILDEATSSLDTHSERLIQKAIENISKTTTVIVVAHRLSTIVNADYIYVLSKGRIVQEGTYSQLASKEGHFSRMVSLQLLSHTM